MGRSIRTPDGRNCIVVCHLTGGAGSYSGRSGRANDRLSASSGVVPRPWRCQTLKGVPMPIKKDETGKRWVEMEFITPGTPEQVWRAMATGPGNTAWFTKTTIDEHVGGRLHFDFGPNGASTGEVTIWEPPFRFGYVEREWSEGAPPVATEITVTSRSGDRCVVRMVHSYLPRLTTGTISWKDSRAAGPAFSRCCAFTCRTSPAKRPPASASWPTRRPASSRLGGGSPRRSVWPAQTSVRSGAARNSRRDYPAWSNACGRTTSSDSSCCA
ncbi:hypothetical protein BQ8482_111238 [Mesorhizobium delmotii]|uniref:SRPBCC domain-containing protein n=1 Tax=Mesorhizobium delmotii TaxID=1631247 RepID=A0A2P9ADU3_9HYPH|nr:hypothetical protein BQ8482_111238 [Mesorhizobium delmotii]